MRAAVAVRSSGLDVIEVEVPQTGPGQVRVRVEAAAVNPVDLATVNGALVEAGLVPARDRLGLGWDVAGTVEEVGPGAGFKVGDRVIGLSDRLDVRLGTHAEQVVLDADAVAHAPTGVSPEDAATLPLSGLTALQALDRLGLRRGQTLLVTGAAGAVGGFAVELAVARGLRVVGLAGAQDEELVRSLGAELFVPRHVERVGEAVRALVPGGVDGAVDAAVLGAAALDAVRGQGSFAALVAGAAPTPLRGTTVHQVWIQADAAGLADLSHLVEEGKLTLRVAGTYPLHAAQQAYDHHRKGGTRGRLVLIP